MRQVKIEAQDLIINRSLYPLTSMLVSKRTQVKDRCMSIDKFFHVTERGSSLKIELLAGLSTYLSLAYILILNPAILSKAGIDPSAALFATAVASGLSTILMGLWARLPFALAPGLEMNGFVVFAAIGVLGLTWQQALGAVFWSGILCVFLTWLPLRSKIIYSIPSGLQANLAFSVGVFVATIALFVSKIIIFESGLPSSLGQLFSIEAIALYLGLIVCIVCRHLVSKSSTLGKVFTACGFLIAILVASVFCVLNGIKVDSPATVSLNMVNAVGQLDFFPFTDPKVFTVFLVLFLIDFYGSIGKFIGLTSATNLRSKDDGVIGIEKAMYVDGIGTIGGAALGTTSIITYVESAIGIHAGGRTGITAIVCGTLLLLSLVFTPLISLVPVVATSGVLVYVGYALLPKKDWDSGKFSRFDLGVGLVMAILSLATFSLDKAMLFGFGAYSLKQLLDRSQKKNPYLIGSFVLLMISVSLQYILKD
jgi:AGZA family xanthine/uracil permease-like MFS transporter